MKLQVTSFRSKVFKEAHRILKNFKGGITFGEALRTAWHLYRTEKERAKYIVKTEATPERIQQIARNINAFDTLYNYIDGGNGWTFWNDLRKKLETILETANKRTKARIITLCDPEQAKYFGLV